MEKVKTVLSLDADAQAGAQALFEDLGLDLSTAVNLFLRQALYENAIPFRVCRDVPNEETRAALEEGDRLLADPDAKAYDSVEALFRDLNADV